MGIKDIILVNDDRVDSMVLTIVINVVTRDGVGQRINDEVVIADNASRQRRSVREDEEAVLSARERNVIQSLLLFRHVRLVLVDDNDVVKLKALHAMDRRHDQIRF